MPEEWDNITEHEEAEEQSSHGEELAEDDVEVESDTLSNGLDEELESEASDSEI